MPSVNKIHLNNPVSRQNVKNLLGYAVKKRSGCYDDICHVDFKKGETVEHFKTAGFIRTGHTLKNETFSITELGDEYYKDLFGTYSYYKRRVLGSIERYKNKIIKKVFNKNG